MMTMVISNYVFNGGTQGVKKGGTLFQNCRPSYAYKYQTVTPLDHFLNADLFRHPLIANCVNCQRTQFILKILKEI